MCPKNGFWGSRFVHTHCLHSAAADEVNLSLHSNRQSAEYPLGPPAAILSSLVFVLPWHAKHGGISSAPAATVARSLLPPIFSSITGLNLFSLSLSSPSDSCLHSSDNVARLRHLLSKFSAGFPIRIALLGDSDGIIWPWVHGVTD